MIIAILFLVMIILSVPIPFVLGLTGVFYIMDIGDPRLFTVITQRMFAGADNFSLLCIPLFILAGELMSYGGLTSRLSQLARALVGHLTGGLAYVNILVGTFMSAIVGSATAVTAVLCKNIIPEMKKDGYEEEFSAALSTATSIIGPIIPPSMFFVIYGATAGVSIGGLFLAGIIPGILLSISFMLISFFATKKRNLPKKERASLVFFCKSFINAVPGLLVPLIILGGILTGVFTPTESAGAASLVALIVGFFIYRELKIKDLVPIFINTGITTASILIILATANIFGWILAIERLPQMITSVLISHIHSPLVFLLLINVLLLFVGMIMESFAAIVILVPVLTPVLAQYGIDPLHFGLIVCLNLVIGLITPPVGICLFVGSSLSNVKLERLIVRIFPFLIISIIVLLIVTYVPGFSLILPRLMLN